MELRFDPVIPLLGLYPKNPESPTQKNLCTPMFITELFTTVKCWKQPKCTSVNEWIKKLWYIYTMEYYAVERKKELLPFVTAWVELWSIMLSEISQAVKGKYHMISPTSEANQQQKKNKKNITRDSEIKKKLTVTGGEVGGVMGGKKVTGCQGTCIKDPWTKPKGRGIDGKG